MTDKEFSKLVADGIDDLREDIRKRMKNVAIVIADYPTDEQRKDNDLAEGEILFGLYEGVPLVERGPEDFLLPDKITIFKEPILKTYADLEDIKMCIANTVWHEVAHHFGFTEEEVRDEEQKRGKIL